MTARLLAIAAACACAACASIEETAPPPDVKPVAVAPSVAPKAPVVVPVPPAPKVERVAPAEPKTSELETLLADFERLRKLGPAELAREQEAARQAFNQSRSDGARIRLAMAVAVPGAPPIEEARALEMLEPLVRNPTAALHGLAFLLSAVIQEQRRSAALVQGLQQNMQGLQQSNQVLQQNVHGLQQKLDALRTLERSLSERGEPVQRKR
jgi:hypothetical protein